MLWFQENPPISGLGKIKLAEVLLKNRFDNEAKWSIAIIDQLKSNLDVIENQNSANLPANNSLAPGHREVSPLPAGWTPLRDDTLGSR